MPLAYSHEPGLGEVSTEDGLDDDDGLLLCWVVLSWGDGAWDTGSRRALQSMTRGERVVWGHPVSKCTRQISPPGASQLTPNSVLPHSPPAFTGRSAGSDFNAKLAGDMSKGLLGAVPPWDGQSTRLISAGKASGL